MLARLWWKEARQFWTIWVFLALVAGGVQWLALRYYGEDVRQGALFLMAVGLACIYAVAVSAAAFAGEREHGTLLLLDTMAVDRWTLWGGKFSFAMASTLALAAALFGLAAYGTGPLNTPPVARNVAMIGLIGGSVLVEVIGWGMLWSAVTSTGLGAAVLAVLSVAVSTPFTMFHADRNPDWALGSAPLRLALAALVTLGSALVMTWKQQWPVAGASGRGRARAAARHEVRARREWSPAVRRLAWQSFHQSGRPVLWLAAIGLVLGVLMPREAVPVWGLFGTIATLWLGSNAFGAESRGRTQRFLTSHGASPSQVWAVKWATGSLGLVLALLPMTIAIGLRHEPPAIDATDVLLFVLGLVNAFAASVLCGMTIRRGITMGVGSLAASIVVIAPQGYLIQAMMLPPWGMLFPPAALLAITWAWSGDWMFERPGAGRWVRLGLLTAGAAALLGASFVGYRVAGVPDAATVAGLATHPNRPTIALEGQNAAPTYLEALRKSQTLTAAKVDSTDPSALVNQVIASGWDASATVLTPWLRANAEALALVRRGASMPQCEFQRLDLATLYTTRPLPELQSLAQLLAVEARERQARGDLAGAWEDIETTLNLVRQLARNAPIRQRILSDEIEHAALRLAMAWAADRGQTPERLHAALDAYRRLSPMPRLSETVEAEWRLAEQTLDASNQELRAGLRSTFGYYTGPLPEELIVDLATTPWEKARARRVFRILFPAKLAESALDPGKRAPLPRGPAGEWSNVSLNTGGATSILPAWKLRELQQWTPLVKWLMPSFDSVQASADRIEVERRALPQVLALRSWQLRHGGRLPKELKELVPGELDRLPDDPYLEGNRPFDYIHWEGGIVMPSSRSGGIPPTMSAEMESPASPRWMLLSAGVSWHNLPVNLFRGQQVDHYDHLVFPLLPEPGPDEAEPESQKAKPDAASPEGA